MAIDLSKMGDPAYYVERVENMITEIKGAKRASGVEKIYFPGEIEAEKYNKCKAEGYVEIGDSVMADIESLEKRCFG